jgi:hypothetical protein
VESHRCSEVERVPAFISRMICEGGGQRQGGSWHDTWLREREEREERERERERKKE